MSTHQTTLSSFFSRSRFVVSGGARTPNTNTNTSAADASSVETSARPSVARTTSSETSVQTPRVTSSMTSAPSSSVEVIAISDGEDSSVAPVPALARRMPVPARATKRPREVVPSDSDTEDDDLPLVAPKARRRKPAPEPSLSPPAPELSFSPPVSAPSAFASGVTIPVPSYTLNPLTYAQLVVFALTALLAFAKLHVEVDDSLTVELLAEIYFKALQTASPSLYAYLDDCVRNAIPWDYETFFSKLGSVTSADNVMHGIYHLRVKRTHPDGSGNVHSYGGSATRIVDGMHHRVNGNHLREGYRQQHKGSYLYSLIDQKRVDVVLTAGASLKHPRTVTTQYGRVVALIFETMHIHFFCGWKFDFSLHTAFPCLLPSRLQTAFASAVSKSILLFTSTLEAEVLALCLKVRGTNHSIPLLEEGTISALERLQTGDGTVSVNLYRDATKDTLSKWRFKLHPNVFPVSPEQLGMKREHVNTSMINVEVKLFLTTEPAEDNFAAVPVDFEHEHFPDVSRLVCQLTWVDVKDNAHTVRYQLSSTDYGRMPAETRLLDTMFAQSMWDHITATEIDVANHWRIDPYSARKNRKVDPALADQIFGGQAVKTKDDYVVYCKGCHAGFKAIDRLIQHLGVYRQFLEGKNVHGTNLTAATKAKIMNCRRKGYGSDRLSHADVKKAHNIGFKLKHAASGIKY